VVGIQIFHARVYRTNAGLDGGVTELVQWAADGLCHLVHGGGGGVSGVNHEYEAVVAVMTTGVVRFRLVFVLGDLFYGIAVFAAALHVIYLTEEKFFTTPDLLPTPRCR